MKIISAMINNKMLHRRPIVISSTGFFRTSQFVREAILRVKYAASTDSFMSKTRNKKQPIRRL